MTEANKTTLVFLTGPTGVGKTAISLAVAKALETEIISCDSMQIYRGMDIGTAKATPYEQSVVTHFGVDIVAPSVRYTVQEYQEQAYRHIHSFMEKGKTPLFVGGTGLYINAIVNDFQFSGVDADFTFRSALEARYESEGAEALLEELRAVDPVIADTLHPNDRKKIIRALEVYHVNQKPFGQDRNEKGRSDRWNALVFVLTDEREHLYERIDRRVDKMLEDGLVEEVMCLVDGGLSIYAQSMEAIGYKEVVWYLRGFVSYQEMKTLIQRNSRNYAKRQLTWWRKDKEAIWIDRSDFASDEQIASFIVETVKG